MQPDANVEGVVGLNENASGSFPCEQYHDCTNVDSSAISVDANMNDERVGRKCYKN